MTDRVCGFIVTLDQNIKDGARRFPARAVLAPHGGFGQRVA